MGLTNTEIVISIINALLGLVAFFGVIVGRNLTDAIKELRETDKDLANKFEKYVRRDDLDDIKRQLSGIFERLDDIKDSMGTKVTREECASNRANYRSGK
jgi:hypothetical protein